MSGWSQRASTDVAAAVDDVEDAVGQPGLAQELGDAHAADRGTTSDGLRMNALPATRAWGSIHSGTITGKLNGVTPAQTPSGS
jgi:hypothetical protein